MATGAAQHIQVAQRADAMIGVIRRRLGHYAFDQNELAAGREGLAAVRQNAGAALVVPIVDRAFQDRRIRAARNELEEIAGDEFRTIASPDFSH